MPSLHWATKRSIQGKPHIKKLNNIHACLESEIPWLMFDHIGYGSLNSYKKKQESKNNDRIVYIPFEG